MSSTKLDPAELERKRLEMVSAAKERDEHRAENVRNYKKRDEEEDAKNTRLAVGGSGGFLMFV